MRIRKSDWYQTKVRYEKTLEDGRVKKAAEHYVVEASSHTEAEARIAEEMACCINGEFEVAGIFPDRTRRYSTLTEDLTSIGTR